MDLFRTWAVEDGQPLAESYLPSARNVNRLCGRGFADVNVTVGAAEQSSDGLRLRLDLGVVLGVMSALIWGYG